MERPREKGHGDYATNAALQLAKQRRHQPARARRAARVRAAGDRGDRGGRGGRARVPQRHRRGRRPGPGRGRHRRRRLDVRHATTARRGRASTSSSSRPTRPARIHLGHTRWAVVGDAIARVLEAAGARVTREFYINDRGNQMDLFGASRRGPGASASRCPTTATRAPTSPTSPTRSSPSTARAARHGAGRRPDRRVPRGGVRPAAARAAGVARALPHRLRRLVLRAEPPRQRRRRRRAGEAALPGAPLRRATARCGCAPPTSATTATGC